MWLTLIAVDTNGQMGAPTSLASRGPKPEQQLRTGEL